MSEKTSVEQEQASNVLSDFKKAAHALLDALELGFFKRVSVLKSGAIHGCKTGPIAHVDRLEVKRFKNGEFHLKCQFFENSSEIQPKEYELEELRSGKGLFLDEKDAERLQLLANLKCLKEAQDQLEKRARKAQEKIGELEARIAEFG